MLSTGAGICFMGRCVRAIQKQAVQLEASGYPGKGGRICFLSCGALCCIAILLVDILHPNLDLKLSGPLPQEGGDRCQQDETTDGFGEGSHRWIREQSALTSIVASLLSPASLLTVPAPLGWLVVACGDACNRCHLPLHCPAIQQRVLQR